MYWVLVAHDRDQWRPRVITVSPHFKLLWHADALCACCHGSRPGQPWLQLNVTLMMAQRTEPIVLLFHAGCCKTGHIPSANAILVLAFYPLGTHRGYKSRLILSFV
jgi:hypothetical protein